MARRSHIRVLGGLGSERWNTLLKNAPRPVGTMAGGLSPRVPSLGEPFDYPLSTPNIVYNAACFVDSASGARESGAAEGPGGSAGAALLRQPGSSPSARLSAPCRPACWPKQTACGCELHAHRTEPDASGQLPAARAPGQAPAPAGACRCSSRPCSHHSRPPDLWSGP